MPATPAERQSALRKRRAEAGYINVTVSVPVSAAPDLTMAARLMQANPALRLAMLTDAASGRYVAIRRAGL